MSTYTFRGEVRKRFRCQGHNPQVGDIVYIPFTRRNVEREVAECRAQVVERYFTVNRGFRNYGTRVRILEGPKKDKLLRFVSVTY